MSQLLRYLFIVCMGVLIGLLVMDGIDFYTYTPQCHLKTRTIEMFYVPDTFTDGDAWMRIENRMEASKADIIWLNWAGRGGLYNSLLMQFIVHVENLRNRGKEVVFNLIGDCYSAHTYAVGYGDVILNNDKYFLMFHPLVQEAFDGALMSFPKDPELLQEYKDIIWPCVQLGIISNENLNKAITIDEVYSIGNSYIDKNHKDHPNIRINRDPRQ